MSFDLAAVVLVVLKGCTTIALAGGAWVLLTALRRMSGLERVAVALLFALGLALRLIAPASPHDIYSRADGALWNPWPAFDRGLGFAAFGQVVQPWVDAWRADDGWLFDRVALAGALVPVLVVAWLSRIGAPSAMTWTAGLIFAFSSPHVRLSHTDAQQLPALTFLWIGLAAWAEHARAPRWLPAMVAGCALAAAGSARLECLTLPIVFAVVALADRGLSGWRHPATATAAVLCFAVVSLHTYGMVFAGTWNPFEYTARTGERWTDHNLFAYGLRQLLIFDPAYTAPPVAVATFAGMFVGPLPTRLRLGVAACMIGLSLTMPVWSPVDGAAFALSRYQVAATPFAAVLAANTLGAVFARWSARWVAVGATGLTLAASASRLPMAYEDSTVSAEYRFIRGVLPTLPAGCNIVYEAWTNDQGLWFPYWMPTLLRLPLTSVELPKWDGDLGTCTVYYRGGSCAVGPKEGPMCGDFPDRHELVPIAEADLPARQWVYDLYLTNPVHVGFYRVTR